ncbi:MAG: hypothetical protein NC091_14020 [Bacteroides sp.]|nr:hypothetical protein [Bacteroides sp.]
MKKELLIVIGSLTLFFIAIITVAYYLAKADCRFYEEQTGRKTKMVFGTCYLKNGNTWYTRNEFRAFIDKND